jgi:hypothetical protein
VTALRPVPVPRDTFAVNPSSHTHSTMLTCFHFTVVCPGVHTQFSQECL